MTYNDFKKIKVYLLMLLIFFIFTKNMQILFYTRNMSEIDHKILPGILFLPKIEENEVNTNKESINELNKPSSGFNALKNEQYIKYKHKESVSSNSLLFDRLLFWLKRAINQFFSLINIFIDSVKYRYLLGQFFLEKQKDIYLERLERVVGSRGLPLVKGVLFGDASSIDQETHHSFKVIGILHVLSASSANFTVFLYFLLFFIRPIIVFLTKKQLFCLYFFIILLYFTLVGAAASTTRAFLTLTLAFYAKFILQRSFSVLTNLYIVAFLMLSINPYFINNLGFQFSFLASFGIIFLYGFLEKDGFIGKNYLLQNISLTICAQLFLLPIFVFNFAELNYLGIFSNFIVVPLVELLSILFLCSFIALFFTDLFSSNLFEYILYSLISKVFDILFYLIDFLEKTNYKSIYFSSNKCLFTGIFILFDLFVVFLILLFKHQKYSKNRYRIFK